MTLYVCEIALEIEAVTPEAAALEAEQQLDDPANRGFVWTVRNTDTNEARDIDASEL